MPSEPPPPAPAAAPAARQPTVAEAVSATTPSARQAGDLATAAVQCKSSVLAGRRDVSARKLTSVRALDKDVASSLRPAGDERRD
jgi:hypothetical protein